MSIHQDLAFIPLLSHFIRQPRGTLDLRHYCFQTPSSSGPFVRRLRGQSRIRCRFIVNGIVPRLAARRDVYPQERPGRGRACGRHQQSRPWIPGQNIESDVCFGLHRVHDEYAAVGRADGSSLLWSMYRLLTTSIDSDRRLGFARGTPSTGIGPRQASKHGEPRQNNPPHQGPPHCASRQRCCHLCVPESEDHRRWTLQRRGIRRW